MSIIQYLREELDASNHINEMPHMNYKGISIDYEFEKPAWVEKLINNLTKYGSKIILKPFYDMKYDIMFRKKFEKLVDSDKQKLLDILPQQFIDDMKLLHNQ